METGFTMLDKFFSGQKKPQEQQNNQGGQGGNNPAAKTAQTSNAGEVVANNNSSNNPGDVNNQNNSGGEQSPLDGFSKLWETKKDKDGNEVKPSGPEPLFKPDQKALSEAVGKMNFASKVDPELAKKALSGDHAALLSVINSTAQEGFSQALLASSQMMDQAFTKKMADFDKSAGSTYKKLRTSETLMGENPQFSHPAVKPMFDMMQEKFSQQYPEASPAEIAQYTQKYFKEFSGVLTANNGEGDDGENQNPSGNGKPQAAQDFSKFFS